MTLTQEQIEAIRTAIKAVLPNACVSLPLKNKEGDYALAIFENQEAKTQYFTYGSDTEAYIIYPTDDIGPLDYWGFSYQTFHPGVYMRADGSGEPDSWEMEEHKEKFLGMKSCVIGLVKFILTRQQLLFCEMISRWSLHYDHNLNSKEQ